MSAHLKAAFESDVSLDQDDRKGTLVHRGGFGSAQNVTGFLGIGTIHDDGFVSLTGKPSNGILRVGAMVDADFEVAEDTTQDTDRSLVGTY
ncbi:MAG: hypothetical protein WA172_15380 [Terriglobales bacterium]